MRTFGALVLLGLALALLHHLSAGAALAARATLALGILAVTADLTGRLVARWGWPRVSGYLASGLVIGPHWLGLIRWDEANALGVIGAAALALFALRAGLAVRGDRASLPAGLSRYLMVSLAVPFAVTTGTVYALRPWFPLTIHQPAGDAVAVALALGALTAVAAPALTWTALQDAPDRRLGEDLLWLNVARDFAALVLFAAVLAVVRLFVSAGALHPAAFWLPLVSLGASVLAGVLLAWLVSRFGGALAIAPGAMLLGVAFVGAVAGTFGHPEATLTALVAGLVLARGDVTAAESLRRHFDARGMALAAPAFALVGAGFDVSGLLDLVPWILVLAGVRAVGLYWAGRWVARGSLVTDVLARQGWLGLISQAGVGLLLAATGRRAFPEWGVSFEALVVALVAVHATIGPICLRWALAQRASFTEGVSGAA